MSALYPLQVAIFAKLEADARLTGKVFDAVPQKTPAPYVVIGEGTGRPDDLHGAQGREDTLTIHGWSQAEENDEVAALMDAVRDVLHRKPITVTGWRTVRLVWEFGEILRDEDYRHAVERYRATLERTA